MDATTSVVARRRVGRPPVAEAGDTRAAVLDAALMLFARHGYRHFPGKQAIYEEVLRQAGVGMLMDGLTGADAALAESDPPAYLRAVAAVPIRVWETTQARRIASVAAWALGETHEDTIAAILRVRDQLAPLFGRWISLGHMPPARGMPEQLAWELFAPCAYVRLLYRHAGADTATGHAGHELVRNHLEFFIGTVFRAPDGSDVP